ncbi:MAG: hypothetical protein KAX63_05345 [Pseudomonas sp.]|nr:hypothetical protein [Pseudomonas sp.]
MIHHWALTAIGFAGAAVLGVLDFLDRTQPWPHQFICTRTRLIADLEGLVGKNKVDEALAQLIKLGWVVRREETVWGQRNLQTRHHYALCPDTVAEFLVGEGISGVPEQGSGKALKRDLPVSRNRDAICKREDVDEEAAMPAREAAAAKAFTRRPSGIACWFPEDHEKARQIEREHPPARIETAAKRLMDSGKEAVPGLVLREIERQLCEQQAVAIRQAAEQRYAALLNLPPSGSRDQAALARGTMLLQKVRHRKRVQKDGLAEEGSS